MTARAPTRRALHAPRAEGPWLIQEAEGGPVWWTDRVLALRLPFASLSFGPVLPDLAAGARWELGDAARRNIVAALRVAAAHAEPARPLSPGLILSESGRRLAVDASRLIAAQVLAGPSAELLYINAGHVLVAGRAVAREGAVGLRVAGELVALLAPRHI